MKNSEFAESATSSSQDGNRQWWETNPMTYDWDGIRQVSEGTAEWYEAIDREFWEISREFAHPDYPSRPPFHVLIDFAALPGKAVLEIGCGMGSHAALLARSGARVTAIDLTQRAVDAANRRFQLFGINNAEAKQVDAEKMPFSDGSFDLVWSWGVIHHSANTEAIVREIHRVLRPGGKAQIMVYNKNSTRYYVHGLYQGVFKRKFLKTPSLYAVNMTFTDGYIARHYTHHTAKDLFRAFKVVSTRVTDSGVPSVVFGWGRLSRAFPALFGPINRFINARWGWFLFVEVEK